MLGLTGSYQEHTQRQESDATQDKRLIINNYNNYNLMCKWGITHTGRQSTREKLSKGVGKMCSAKKTCLKYKIQAVQVNRQKQTVRKNARKMFKLCSMKPSGRRGVCTLGCYPVTDLTGKAELIAI